VRGGKKTIMKKKIILNLLTFFILLLSISTVIALENSAEQYAQSLGIEKSAIKIISRLDRDNQFDELEKDFITWLASQDKESQFKLAFKYAFDGKITDEEITGLNLDSSKSSSTPSVSSNEKWAEFMPGYCIQDIELDGEYLWLGTDEGLIKFSKSGKQPPIIFTKKDGLIGNDVQAVKIYNNEIWIGTADRGLSKFNGVNFTNYGSNEGLFDCRVMALDVNQDYVWLGLTTGLSKFTKKTEKFKNFELPGGYVPGSGLGSSGNVSKKGIRRVFADSILIEGRNIWYGARDLYKSDFKLNHTKHCKWGNEIPDHRVTDLDRNEKFVFVSAVGDYGGISLINIKNKEVKLFRRSSNLVDSQVYALFSEGNFLWLATETTITKVGLKNYHFQHHYFPYDFKGNCILSLAVEQKYLWIGTVFGLYRLKKF
jgi:ligand-binding sensor domain-containing protein